MAGIDSASRVVDIVEKTQRVRVWCFRCARGAELDDATLIRAQALSLDELATRCRCSQCRQSDQVLALPASWPTEPARSWEQEVAAFFHSERAKAKKRQRR